MATVNFISGFDFTDESLIDFNAFVASDAFSYTWDALLACRITALSATGNITVDAGNLPNTGTIDAFSDMIQPQTQLVNTIADISESARRQSSDFGLTPDFGHHKCVRTAKKGFIYIHIRPCASACLLLCLQSEFRRL